MKIIMFFIGALAATPTFASNKASELILSLQSKSNAQIVSRIDLFSNDIDPNSMSVGDQYRLEINGKEVKVPEQVLRKLDSGRRLYSYDYFTGGIPAPQGGGLCRMGGPARGNVLYVRYLTYKEERIVSSEMRPVFGSGNCLFMENYSPANADARAAAAAAMEALLTVREMLAGNKHE